MSFNIFFIIVHDDTEKVVVSELECRLLHDVIMESGFEPSPCDLIHWLNRMRLECYEDFLEKAHLEPCGASGEALVHALNARAAAQNMARQSRFHVHY